MNVINDFLRSQTDDGAYLYGLMGTLGVVLMVLVVVFYLIRTRANWLTWIKGVAIAAITYYFNPYAHWFMVWYRDLIPKYDNLNEAANLALAFTLLPLLVWLCAKTFNTSTGFSGDVVALASLGFHVLGRSGCLFTGCCYGFPCEWGWYSHDALDNAVHSAINQGVDPSGLNTPTNYFPTSLVESLFTLAILVFLIVRICRKNYTPDGKNLPYFLLFYGTCRFFSEITRESTRDEWLFWRISDIHFHMVLMAVVGGLMLWFIAKKERAAAVGEGPSLPVLKGKRT